MQARISILICLGMAFFSCIPADAQTAKLKPGPVGIVCLPPGNNPQHPLRNLADDPAWNNPEVKGFMIRDFWPMVEAAEGRYDFSLFDQALALAHQHNKFLGLAVCAGRSSPDWIYAAGAQKFDFSRPGHAGAEERDFHMPIPWDPVFQAKWGALIKEMGRRYDADPNVAYIAMTGPGRDFETYFVSSPADVERFDQMDGQSQWAKAYRAIVDGFAAAFPHTILIYPMGPPTPDAEGHETVNGAVDRLLSAYPHQFGVCSDALAPFFSPTTPSGMVIRQEGPHRTVGFQMLLPSKGGQTMHGAPLSDALELGVDYKAHYIEVYTIDCRDPDQQSGLHQANAGLAANSKVPSSP